MTGGRRVNDAELPSLPPSEARVAESGRCPAGRFLLAGPPDRATGPSASWGRMERTRTTARTCVVPEEGHASGIAPVTRSESTLERAAAPDEEPAASRRRRPR